MKLYVYITPDIPKYTGFLKIGEIYGNIEERVGCKDTNSTSTGKSCGTMPSLRIAPVAEGFYFFSQNTKTPAPPALPVLRVFLELPSSQKRAGVGKSVLP